MATNTIVLKGMGHHDEGVVGTAISPGEAVRLASDGEYDPETLTAVNAAARGLKLAKEDALQGKTVDDAYAVGDTLFFYSPLPGDHVQVLVKSGEDIDVGDYLSVEGGGSGKFVEVSSSANATYPLELTNARVHDAMATLLPATAANDDMAIITGTPGTYAPTLQGVDFGGATSDEKGAFAYTIPHDYRAAGDFTVRVRAAMLTTVADDSCTVDVEVWKVGADGVVGSDICATAAQDMNSLTAANFDFTITPTTLNPGDKLVIRVSFAGTDAGNAGVMIPEISAVSVLIADAVGGQLESLEDSGGALAANTLLKARVVAV